MKPMLAESVDQQRLIDFCHDDQFAMEHKLDGERLMVRIEGAIEFLNRSGLPASRLSSRLRTHLQQEFQQFQSDTSWIFDGEVVEGTFHVFDLVRAGSLVGPGTGWEDRRLVLEQLFTDVWNPDYVSLVPTYRDTLDKLLAAKTVKEGRGEGVMFKRVNGLYVPGKRTSAMVKVKFTCEIDCVVTELHRDGKNNMVLAVYREGELVEVGECTRLAGDGQKVREPRSLSDGTLDYDVVAIKCLYVSKDYRLVQPTKPRLRTDKTAVECVWEQLPPHVTNKAVQYKSRN